MMMSEDAPRCPECGSIRTTAITPYSYVCERCKAYTSID